MVTKIIRICQQKKKKKKKGVYELKASVEVLETVKSLTADHVSWERKVPK